MYKKLFIPLLISSSLLHAMDHKAKAHEAAVEGLDMAVPVAVQVTLSFKINGVDQAIQVPQAVENYSDILKFAFAQKAEADGSFGIPTLGNYSKEVVNTFFACLTQYAQHSAKLAAAEPAVKVQLQQLSVQQLNDIYQLLDYLITDPEIQNLFLPAIVALVPDKLVAHAQEQGIAAAQAMLTNTNYALFNLQKAAPVKEIKRLLIQQYPWLLALTGKPHIIHQDFGWATNYSCNSSGTFCATVGHPQMGGLRDFNIWERNGDTFTLSAGSDDTLVSPDLQSMHWITDEHVTLLVKKSPHSNEYIRSNYRRTATGWERLDILEIVEQDNKVRCADGTAYFTRHMPHELHIQDRFHHRVNGQWHECQQQFPGRTEDRFWAGSTCIIRENTGALHLFKFNDQDIEPAHIQIASSNNQEMHLLQTDNTQEVTLTGIPPLTAAEQAAAHGQQEGRFRTHLTFTRKTANGWRTIPTEPIAITTDIHRGFVAQSDWQRVGARYMAMPDPLAHILQNNRLHIIDFSQPLEDMPLNRLFATLVQEKLNDAQPVAATEQKAQAAVEPQRQQPAAPAHVAEQPWHAKAWAYVKENPKKTLLGALAVIATLYYAKNRKKINKKLRDYRADLRAYLTGRR